ncbi:MAG: hypothetical protein ACXWCY_14205 [Burkholderiales bacterium]
MIDDQLVLRIERLRDDVEAFKAELRRYPKDRSVSSAELRKKALAIAERWLVEVPGRADLADAIGANTVAEQSVQFQRLLTYSEKLTLRKKYDQAINAILKDFRRGVILPLKAHRAGGGTPAAPQPALSRYHLREASIAFIGQSFVPADEKLNALIARFLRALGLTVLTGEKPRADAVSKKVRDRIDKCHVFIGIFTRRDKLEGKAEWGTSSWVVDEKAYALARGKKLVLLKEHAVGSIGGLQGDYEYLEFERTALEELLVKVLETFLSDDAKP